MVAVTQQGTTLHTYFTSDLVRRRAAGWQARRLFLFRSIKKNKWTSFDWTSDPAFIYFNSAWGKGKDYSHSYKSKPFRQLFTKGAESDL